MKRTIMVTALALMLVFGTVASAFATSQNYSFVLPRLQGDIYSTAKTVSAYRDFGVQHKYSGSYPVRFAVCNTSRQPIGPSVLVYPGGSSADLVDLWYNSSSSARSIVVRLDSGKLNAVTILAEGTWVWNY